MIGNRRNGEAAQRFAERRRREDEAPRLQDEVPTLASLKLEVDDRQAGAVSAEAKHVRRIVVENAPALFVISCGDLRCKDGGHDLTHEIMRALRSRTAQFEGTDECRGSLGTSECRRILHYSAFATYR